MSADESFAVRGRRRLRWASAGSGPPLVLLPGIGSGMALFGTLPRRFARSGRRAVTYDPAGIPPSSPLEGPDHSFEAAADDVWAVADAAGETQVDLVGTSFGGKVALVAAARRPDRVRRVVLLGSAAVVSARAQRVYRFFETVAEQVAPERFADVVAPFLFGRTFLTEHAALVDDIVRTLRPDGDRRRTMLAQARALQAFDGSSVAREVAAPTLCLAGVEDTLTDAADVRATAKLLRAGSYQEFRAAGHSLLLEHAAVYDAIDAFLRT